jgi:hypothetical protein
MFKRKDGTTVVDARWISVGIAVIYGVLARISFGLGSSSGLTSTLSWGFITLVPLGIGALSVFFASDNERYDYGYSVSAALTSSLIFLGIALIFAFELFICILMAAPFFLAISAVGAWLMCLVLRLSNRNYSVLAILLILPYIVSPMERFFPPLDSIRTVETQILINASAETIWQNIIRVPEIMPEEQHFDFFHLAGIPRPVEATLAIEGERVGGTRHGYFDNGLIFVETITDWQPLETISFDIHVRGRANVPAPFSEIGGRIFEILDASYTLEPVGEGQILLHLSSRHRLTTNFNAYGGLWTDWMLSDFQNYVLSIVKARCEA